jgi:hypothetical protein
MRLHEVEAALKLRLIAADHPRLLTSTGCLASQVAEVPSTRDRLRKELDLEFHPLLLMRIGRAAPTPASKRRDPSMIISEAED